MANRFTITLTDEQQARLERIAEAREMTVVGAVEEAVTAFIHRDAAYRAYIQEGIDAVARGEVHDWEDVKAEMRAKYGNPDE